MARDKINSIDEFLEFEALVAVEDLKGRVSGLELAQILQPAAQTVAPTESSSGTKKNIYKPNEDFLMARKKPCPWYRVSDTSVPLEDLAAISDYLMSGGSFSDVKTPIMFLRKTMDPEMFRSFSGVIAQAFVVN